MIYILLIHAVIQASRLLMLQLSPKNLTEAELGQLVTQVLTHLSLTIHSLCLHVAVLILLPCMC